MWRSEVDSNGSKSGSVEEYCEYSKDYSGSIKQGVQELSEWFWNGSSRPYYLLLLSHATYAEFLLWGLYILKSSQLLSWSHIIIIIIIIIIDKIVSGAPGLWGR